MSTEIILLVIAVLCAFWFVISSVLIYENLKRRGQKVSFFWLRALAPMYAFQYKKITRSETGRTGLLFYHWIISINAALFFVLVALAVHYL